MTADLRTVDLGEMPVDSAEVLRYAQLPKNAAVPEELPLGECLDNARASGFFNGISGALGIPIKELPYAFMSPEWSNEKGICAALAFRLLGMNSYHSVYAPTQGAPNVHEFMAHGTKPILGSEMIVNVDTKALAQQLVDDLNEKRRLLGWK